MITVTWSATDIESDKMGAIVANWKSEVQGNLAAEARDAEDYAQAVAECYFAQDNHWAENYGDDECTTIKVEIHTPESIAGVFEVDLERTVKARARRMIPVMRATG